MEKQNSLHDVRGLSKKGNTISWIGIIFLLLSSTVWFVSIGIRKEILIETVLPELQGILGFAGLAFAILGNLLQLKALESK